MLNKFSWEFHLHGTVIATLPSKCHEDEIVHTAPAASLVPSVCHHSRLPRSGKAVIHAGPMRSGCPVATLTSMANEYAP